jgi:hypothetical protein
MPGLWPPYARLDDRLPGAAPAPPEPRVHLVPDEGVEEGAGLPYREALASLATLAGLELSVHAAEDIVARWGEAELVPEPYA